MGSTDGSDDDLSDEILGALRRKTEIEMLDEQQIDAEPRQFALLDAERRQSERLGRREEHGARVRLEGQYRGGPTLGPRKVVCLRDQHSVAAMQAIEIAHREDGAPWVIRSGTGMSDDANHGGTAWRSFIISNLPRK
jgi:hypothetical protein